MSFDQTKFGRTRHPFEPSYVVSRTADAPRDASFVSGSAILSVFKEGTKTHQN